MLIFDLLVTILYVLFGNHRRKWFSKYETRGKRQRFKVTAISDENNGLLKKPNEGIIDFWILKLNVYKIVLDIELLINYACIINQQLA